MERSAGLLFGEGKVGISENMSGGKLLVLIRTTLKQHHHDLEPESTSDESGFWG